MGRPKRARVLNPIDATSACSTQKNGLVYQENNLMVREDSGGGYFTSSSFAVGKDSARSNSLSPSLCTSSQELTATLHLIHHGVARSSTVIRQSGSAKPCTGNRV